MMVNWGDERLPERFWDKVEPCPMSGCWIWTGSGSGGDLVNPKTTVFGRAVSVRRVAYRTLVSQVPNRVLRASCQTKGCCNPMHVTLARKTDYETLMKIAGWQRNNKDRRRSYTLKYKYGITPEAFDQLLIDQSGMCAVCSVAFDQSGSKNGRMACAVDHCHVTKKVRALLCKRCNSGLGYFRDRPEALRSAATYLEKHAAKT